MTVRQPLPRASAPSANALPSLVTSRGGLYGTSNGWASKNPAMARGGNLRIGKVITDARAVVNTAKAFNDEFQLPRWQQPPLPEAASRFLDGEERRVQEEIIDMLTNRLAKKERENEMYRRHQEASDSDRDQHEARVSQLESELTAARDASAERIEQLQHETHEAKLRADRCCEEVQLQRAALQDFQRQRERDTELSRSKEQQLVRQVEELQRELALTQAEKQALEIRVVRGQEQQGTWKERTSALERQCAELEAAAEQANEKIDELVQQLEASLAQAHAQDDLRQKLEQEKQSLEDKVQQLSRNLREVSSRASDAERRKSDLSHAESHMSKQLTELHRESEELRARNGQLQAQSKQHQTRITSLEGSKAAAEAKLKEASEEVEQARKRCREYQFRVKQLQEEVVFLTKKKPVPSSQPSITPSTTMAVAAQPPNDGVPSWMRD